jgi:hypothetical protein
MNDINTIEDLFRHFGVDFDPKDMDKNNRSLSRRLYKDTDCGAWARVALPGTKKVGSRPETWTCSYRKVAGIWERGLLLFDGDPVLDSKVPAAVLSYFWPAEVDVQETLQDLAEGRADFQLTETIDVPVLKPHGGVLTVGSIVEGTDAEVVASPVYLPCKSEELDVAVQYVEDECASIWDATHGCDHCGADGAINPDCESCKGAGAIV